MSKLLVLDGVGDASDAARSAMAHIAGHAYDVQATDASVLACDPWAQSTALVVLPDAAPAVYTEAMQRVHTLAGGKKTRVHAALLPYILCGGSVLAMGGAATFACPDMAGDASMHGGPSAVLGHACSAEVLETFEGAPGRASRVVLCRVGQGKVLLVGCGTLCANNAPALAPWLGQALGLDVASTAPRSITNPPRLTPWLLASRSQALLDQFTAPLTASPFWDISQRAPFLHRALSAWRLVANVHDTHSDYAIVQCAAPAKALPALTDACLNADYALYQDALARVPNVLVVLGPDARLLMPDDAAQASRVAPYFVLPHYFDALQRARAAMRHCPMPWPHTPSEQVGDLLLYGQVVTSTQTMLEKNAAFLRACPLGTTLVATHQVAPRARGSNAWISPCGCLQFSTRLALPARAGAKAVFLQYLVALAVVYGLSTLMGPTGACLQGRIRIKWPNDVYAQVPEKPADGVCVTRTEHGETRHYVKIGGILVHALYMQGKYDLVVGCGVNCLNEQPTTSISKLVRAYGSGEVTQEQCAGAIFAAFDSLVHAFQAAHYSFAPFAKAYQAAWLHDDQEIGLEDHGNVRVRVVGLTSDYGLLRTAPLGAAVRASDAEAWGDATQPGFIDLQPDGNSFDMLQNMMRTKT